MFLKAIRKKKKNSDDQGGRGATVLADL